VVIIKTIVMNIKLRAMNPKLIEVTIKTLALNIKLRVMNIKLWPRKGTLGKGPWTLYGAF